MFYYIFNDIDYTFYFISNSTCLEYNCLVIITS